MVQIYGATIQSLCLANPNLALFPKTSPSVTYIDTSIGKDGQNEVVTISKEEFLKVWQGHVFAKDETILKAVSDSPQTAKVLTDRQAQSARGAFFGNILGILGTIFYVIPGMQGFGFLFSALSAAVNAIQGDWISAISSIVAIGFGGVGESLGGVFGGIQSASEQRDKTTTPLFTICKLITASG